MDKTTNQIKTDQEWYDFWEKSGFFKADPTSAKKPYSLLMPPPNLTGQLHLGHAMQHVILDAVARFKRMQQYDVLLLPGVDHAGIQFESTLNKLLAKEDLTKSRLGREAWLKRAWEFKDKIYESFHQVWKSVGISADWSREVFTLDPQVSEAVFTEFKTFWDQGLLYKGAYIVQWCPKDGTAIEDVEMEYQERIEKLYFVKYQIAEKPDEFITIATVRPETIFADSGIAVYPNHLQFSQYVGMTAINPLTQEHLPIFEDVRVEKEFGTGALKITPGHDLLDFEIARDHGLPTKHAISKIGQMTEIAQITSAKDNQPAKSLVGLKVAEARTHVAEFLQQIGSLEKVEEHTHTVPVCERCKTTIEPLISEEWFVKMKPLAEKALKNIDKINFYPTNYKKVITDWMEQIHDWSISRSLWWGHRIPVWYCQKCNPGQIVSKDKVAMVSLQEPLEACPNCQESHWIQEEKILDTWFSSGMWPLATLGWPKETTELTRYFPWDFEISAGDIKYLWIARMIMLSEHFEDNIPFKHMFFTGTVRDMQGRRFSKSLGNGIEPEELLKAWGIDATRMALYSYSAAGRDSKTSRQAMDERAKNYRNFNNKLRNIKKFIIDLKPEETSTPSTPHPDDEWITTELDKTITEVTRNLESFQLHLAADAIYDFIWHKLADIYIEKSKSRRAESQATLESVFRTSLELLHPFMPFITEDLWQQLPHQGESIMFATWPTPHKNS